MRTLSTQVKNGAARLESRDVLAGRLAELYEVPIWLVIDGWELGSVGSAAP